MKKFYSLKSVFIKPYRSKLTSFREIEHTINMIINIFEKRNIINQLPVYEFKWDEQIAVNKIIIQWSSSKSMSGIVVSDLIDHNQFNPRQQLCSFTKSEGSTVTDIEFLNPVFYDIQKRFLHDATISVEALFSNEIQHIKNIYIQLITK